MLTDSHCHLSHEQLVGNIEPILQTMQQAGVNRALCIATTLEEFGQVHALTQQHAPLWCSVGVHPDNEGVQEPSVDDLIQRAGQAKVLGIGETGLDYFDMAGRKGGRSIADMEWQRERFRVHIRAAQQVRKPLIIHTRNAADATLEILAQEGEDGASRQQAGGVFHCFAEDLAVARRVLDIGYYISFAGIVTFKNAQSLKEVAQFVPLDRMLVETDSPYLAPVPHRGKLNTPAHVVHVAQCIADLRGLPFEQIAEATTVNFDTLFCPESAGA